MFASIGVKIELPSALVFLTSRREEFVHFDRLTLEFTRVFCIAFLFVVAYFGGKNAQKKCVNTSSMMISSPEYVNREKMPIAEAGTECGALLVGSGPVSEVCNWRRLKA